jgi:hypothetical protein
MKISKYKYVSLEGLAIELYLPKMYLKRLTERNLIPSLDVNGRMRFNPSAVQNALDKMASKGVAQNEAGK